MSILGYLFWWELHDVRIPHTELRQRLDEAGFRVPLDPPTPHMVEQRVQREAQRTADQPGADTAALRARYDGMHIARDVTRVLVILVAGIGGAVGVRSDGKLMFAPSEVYADLVRLRTLVRALPTADRPPVLFLVAVEDEPQTRDHLAEAVMAGLLQDLAALERDLGRLARRGRVKLPETLADRRVQVQAATDRVATHTGLLAVAQQATVQEALDRVEHRLTELERER
jgi:hypothetical protein